MRSRHLAAIGLAMMVAGCAHSGAEIQTVWLSTNGADEARFYADTADCLSRPASEFVPCMNGKGWEEQASVGAARSTLAEH